jgi:hypothetical protein
MGDEGGFRRPGRTLDVGSRTAASCILGDHGCVCAPEVAPTCGSRWTHVKCPGSTIGAAAEAEPSPDGLLSVGEQTWSGESWHSRGDVTAYAHGCCGRPV